MSDQPADKDAAGKPAERETYDLAPAEPAPATTPAVPVGRVVERAGSKARKVGDKPLLDDFEEDADFSADPEVERTLKGDAPVEATTEEPSGPLFVKPGRGELKPIAIAAGSVLVAAIIAAGITAASRERVWYRECLQVAYMTLFHAASGTGAVLVAAALRHQRVGDVLLGAARMGLAVALFQFFAHLNLPLPGRSEEIVLGAVAYGAAVQVLFRWTLDDFRNVAALHAAAWLSVYLAALLGG